MPAWSQQTEDLNVNYLVLDPGSGIAEHLNPAVDVLIVAIAGSGTVTIDGEERALGAGQAIVIPKGASRAIRSGEATMAYLSCHRRRDPLRPKPL